MSEPRLITAALVLTDISNEYILMTETFHQLISGLSDGESLEETYDDLGTVKVRLLLPGEFPGTTAHLHSTELSGQS